MMGGDYRLVAASMDAALQQAEERRRRRSLMVVMVDAMDEALKANERRGSQQSETSSGSTDEDSTDDDGDDTPKVERAALNALTPQCRLFMRDTSSDMDKKLATVQRQRQRRYTTEEDSPPLFNAETPGTTQQERRRTRVSHDVTYPEHTVTEHEEMCSICMDSIDQTEENERANHDGAQGPATLLSLQSCRHKFHIFCLAGAVQAASAIEETPKCALCRTRISESDLDAIDDVVTNSVVCSTAPTCTPKLLVQPGGLGMRAMTSLPAVVEHAVPYSQSQSMPWRRSMPFTIPQYAMAAHAQRHAQRHARRRSAEGAPGSGERGGMPGGHHRQESCR